MSERIARTHSLQRTSPKGPGSPFVGTCTLCGREGLKASQANEYCDNILGLTEDERLVDAIKGAEQ